MQIICVENCWKLLKIVENCWKLLKIFENCWKLLKLLKIAENCWKLWKIVENCGKLLKINCHPQRPFSVKKHWLLSRFGECYLSCSEIYVAEFTYSCKLDLLIIRIEKRLLLVWKRFVVQNKSNFLLNFIIYTDLELQWH